MHTDRECEWKRVERLAPKPLENNALRATRSTCAMKTKRLVENRRERKEHKES